MVSDGDHNIKEESVDVDNKVGICSTDSRELGLQANDVIPASCPIRSASNVIENFWELPNKSLVICVAWRKNIIPSQISFDHQDMSF